MGRPVGGARTGVGDRAEQILVKETVLAARLRCPRASFSHTRSTPQTLDCVPIRRSHQSELRPHGASSILGKRTNFTFAYIPANSGVFRTPIRNRSQFP